MVGNLLAVWQRWGSCSVCRGGRINSAAVGAILLHLLSVLIDETLHVVTCKDRNASIGSLVADEAVEDSVNRHVQDIHEHSGSHERDDGNQDSGANGLVQVSLEVLSNVNIRSSRSQNRCEDLADEQSTIGSYHDSTNTHHVVSNQRESVLGRFAEGSSVDSSLNVRVFGDELDAAVEDAQAAVDAAEDNSEPRLSSALVRSLGLKVHSKRAGSLAKSDQQGAEGDSTKVETENSLVRAPNGSVSDGFYTVIRLGEVPLGNRERNDKRTTIGDEIHGPEEHKEHEPKLDSDIAVLLNDPLATNNHLLAATCVSNCAQDGLGMAFRCNEQAVVDPWDKEQNKSSNLQNWNKNHDGHLLQGVRRHGHTLNGHVDRGAEPNHE